MMASMQLSAPLAITPFYAMPRPNAPIVLFRGRVDLADETTAERHRGGIVLKWLPSPAVSVWARGAVSDLALNVIMEPDSVAIVPRTPDDHVPAQSKTARGGSRSARTSFETGRKLLGYECGDSAAQLSHALLHIANFRRLHGRVVTWPDGSAAPGRMVFESGPWRIVMDEVQDADAAVKELNGSGGFALTHTARVEQLSGGTFTVPALAELVEAFTFFCWLCTEARCGPVLPVGFDDQGHAVWSRWNPTVTESFPSARTWLDCAHSGEAEVLFPLFMDRFAHPYWRQVLRHAIAYLIDAGRPSPVNRAIIMAQVLLEAVSYSWLVEERKLRSHDDFEGHRTGRPEHPRNAPGHECAGGNSGQARRPGNDTEQQGEPRRRSASPGDQAERDRAPPPSGAGIGLRSHDRGVAARRVVLRAGRASPLRLHWPVPKPPDRRRGSRRCGARALSDEEKGPR